MALKLKRDILPLARSQAAKSGMHYRLGAVVWKRDKILGAGYNNMRIDPKDVKNRPLSIHAERDALKGIPRRDLRGADLFCVRLTARGKIAHSKSCPGCVRLLTRRGFRSIWYYNNMGLLERIYL